MLVMEEYCYAADRRITMEETKIIETAEPEELKEEDLEKAAGGSFCLVHSCKPVFAFILDGDESKKYLLRRCVDCGWEVYLKYFVNDDDWHQCGFEEFNWAQNSGRITGQQHF